MTRPFYKGLQKEQIPSYSENGVSIHLIAGSWKNYQGPFQTLTNITAMRIEMNTDAELSIDIPKTDNIFFYVIRGEIQIAERVIDKKKTILFSQDQEQLKLRAIAKTEILLCHAPPLLEPVVSYGPFVMNSKKEIEEAIRDYQNGKFE